VSLDFTWTIIISLALRCGGRLSGTSGSGLSTNSGGLSGRNAANVIVRVIDALVVVQVAASYTC
jgi:hypothetical protein